MLSCYKELVFKSQTYLRSLMMSGKNVTLSVGQGLVMRASEDGLLYAFVSRPSQMFIRPDPGSKVGLRTGAGEAIGDAREISDADIDIDSASLNLSINVNTSTIFAKSK